MFSVVLLSLVIAVKHVICDEEVVLTASIRLAIPDTDVTFSCRVHVRDNAYVVVFRQKDAQDKTYRFAKMFQTRDGRCRRLEQWPQGDSVTCGEGTNTSNAEWTVFHYKAARVGSIQQVPDVTLWKCEAFDIVSKILRFTVARTNEEFDIKLTASYGQESTVELTCSVPKDKMFSPIISFYPNFKPSTECDGPDVSFLQGDGECFALDTKPGLEMSCGEGTFESESEVRRYRLVMKREDVRQTSWRCGIYTCEMSNEVVITV